MPPLPNGRASTLARCLTTALALVGSLAVMACQPASPRAGGDTSKGPADPAEVATCTSPPPPEGRLRRIERAAAERISASSRLVGRGPDRLELWTTPHGEFWVLPTEFDTLAWVLAEQEVGIYGDESSGVQHGDVVLDCGAHFGGFTQKALAMGAQLVVAIEVAPDNVDCLRKTFVDEVAGGRVIIYPKGVWHEDDELALDRAEKSWANRVVEGEREGRLVPLTTVDKLVAELKLSRVDFIKMDIEGAEPNALRGAAETLRRFRPRMAIAAYHGGEDDLVVLPAVALAAQREYEVCVWGREAGWGNRTLFFK